MKRSKLTESQIVAMLNEGQAGVKVEDICRQYGIAKSSYYKLRSKYQGMGVSDLQRLILKNLKVSAGLMDHFLVKQNLRDLT
uniref:transposase n=1 Tax=Piscirickettsia salmonis TaxID=1238 RepID=UPI0039F67E0E